MKLIGFLLFFLLETLLVQFAPIQVHSPSHQTASSIIFPTSVNIIILCPVIYAKWKENEEKKQRCETHKYLAG